METSSYSGGAMDTNLYQFKDEDLLVSIFFNHEKFGSTMNVGGQRLLGKNPRTGVEHARPNIRFTPGPRTVFSWLIRSGVISEGETICFRNQNDNTEVKRGLITLDGILCECCRDVLSVSKFKSHAGFLLNQPCRNLVLESGKPLILCQLEAWSKEYRARKAGVSTSQVGDIDQSDDLCNLCGLAGNLVCCDNCPATFHQACLLEEKLPEGSWYCRQCCCVTCEKVILHADHSTSSESRRCSLCKHKYHLTCVKKEDATQRFASDTWLCQQICHEVYTGIQSRIGLKNHIGDEIYWTLLRCMDGDLKAHSSWEFVGLKAECNSKLAVALTLMEECFVEMVDEKTKVDMIPQAIYNWGSHFGRLNFEGFHTVILEENDVVLAVASIRIHGVQVAELPFIATCSENRGKGLCKLLVSSIEQMLRSLKIKKLVVAAHKDLVGMWTKKFGFKGLEEDERENLRKINMMVLPGSIWLAKSL